MLFGVPRKYLEVYRAAFECTQETAFVPNKQEQSAEASQCGFHTASDMYV